MSKDDDRGAAFTHHVEHWEWYYNQQEQAIATLISYALSLKEKTDEVNAALLQEYYSKIRLDTQREETAAQLKMQKASNEHFAAYKPKGYVTKKGIEFS
jgi:hypothetical protein